MVISHAEAERVVAGAKAKALEMGFPFSIAVVDPRGDLVALLRLDGARWTSPHAAWGKAAFSATFGVPSADWNERALGATMRSIMQVTDGHFIPQQGALPIKRGDEVIGAVGVSGSGQSANDDEVAQAGIDAL